MTVIVSARTNEAIGENKDINIQPEAKSVNTEDMKVSLQEADLAITGEEDDSITIDGKKYVLKPFSVRKWYLFGRFLRDALGSDLAPKIKKIDINNVDLTAVLDLGLDFANKTIDLLITLVNNKINVMEAEVIWDSEPKEFSLLIKKLVNLNKDAIKEMSGNFQTVDIPEEVRKIYANEFIGKLMGSYLL